MVSADDDRRTVLVPQRAAHEEGRVARQNAGRASATEQRRSDEIGFLCRNEPSPTPMLSRVSLLLLGVAVCAANTGTRQLLTGRDGRRLNFGTFKTECDVRGGAVE